MIEDTPKKTTATDSSVDSNTNPNDACLHVYAENVALPEIRTGKVDLEDEFDKDQSEEAAEECISFDTVALPEYHTGKCPEHEPDREEHESHGLLSDLVRTIANGCTDE